MARFFIKDGKLDSIEGEEEFKDMLAGRGHMCFGSHKYQITLETIDGKVFKLHPCIHDNGFKELLNEGRVRFRETDL